MLPLPPISTLFPYTRSSDLLAPASPRSSPCERRQGPSRSPRNGPHPADRSARGTGSSRSRAPPHAAPPVRSEEHTSELQSQSNLVCRLLLEKKKPTDSETIP